MFNSDLRNLGGRKQITQQMNNHHSKLMNIKPVLKFEAPRPHVDKFKLKRNPKPSEQLIFSPNYAMVRATYQTIANMRGGHTDHKRPETYQLIKKLSKNKKPNKFHQTEHMKNLASLQRRISDIGNVNT